MPFDVPARKNRKPRRIPARFRERANGFAARRTVRLMRFARALPAGARPWAASLLMATGGALFLALVGPFGSYLGTSFGARLLFQLFCFWTGTLLYGLAIQLIRARVRDAAMRWTAILLAAAAITLPFAWMTRLVAAAMWPFIARIGFGVWYWQGLVTAEPVVVLLALLLSRGEARSPAVAELPVTPAEGLLGIAPSEVLCLQMEDHYVRVHGPTGSHLVLATLGQAMELVAAVDGMQVHRSWWIARRAVVKIERDGRNLRIRLSNGVTAPVSRTSVASVRAAGLIGGDRAF